jgi:DNA-binding response OmpR family regulator
VSLLLIEDNERLAASLDKGLSEEGFVVEAIARGLTAKDRLRQGEVDLVVLDLGLPDVDGMEVLADARSCGLAIPILVLTARDSVDDRVQALDRGADDYLVKPFAFAELLARVRALLRRAAATPPRSAKIECGDIVLSPRERAVRVRGAPVDLTPKQYAILELLLRRRDEVVTRADILRDVFDYHFDPGTNLIDVHVGQLRRRLAGSVVTIDTVRGVGFRLGAKT